MSIAKLVTFGRGGDTVHCGTVDYGTYKSSSTITGYGSPERPHAAEIREGKDLIIPDGTPALDKLPALETEDGIRWAIRGPLVDVDLPDGAVSECPDTTNSLLKHSGWAGYIALHEAHKGKDPGPLDSVCIGEYIAGWVRLGARVGNYQNGVIVWE